MTNERMAATASEIPEEQAIFGAAWNYLKEFYYLKQDEPTEMWDRCTKWYSKLSAMGTVERTRKLSEGLAVAVMRYIELRSKEQ